MRALLEAPDRLADEYQRRLKEAYDGRAKSEELAQIVHQIAALQRGIGRLIDSYAAGVIDRSEPVSERWRNRGWMAGVSCNSNGLSRPSWMEQPDVDPDHPRPS